MSKQKGDESAFGVAPGSHPTFPMKIIYIASPYTLGDVAANVAVQIEAAHKIMDAGHCPVAPLLSHYLHINRQRPYHEWVEMDLALIPRMDVVLRLPGKSIGADGEVALAEKHGVPVAHGWENLWPLLANVASEPRRGEHQKS